MRGWRAVSASGLQGKGSPKKKRFFCTDTGIEALRRAEAASLAERRRAEQELEQEAERPRGAIVRDVICSNLCWKYLIVCL